jgi:hypothetical protein
MRARMPAQEESKNRCIKKRVPLQMCAEQVRIVSSSKERNGTVLTASSKGLLTNDPRWASRRIPTPSTPTESRRWRRRAAGGWRIR